MYSRVYPTIIIFAYCKQVLVCFLSRNLSDIKQNFSQDFDKRIYWSVRLAMLLEMVSGVYVVRATLRLLRGQWRPVAQISNNIQIISSSTPYIYSNKNMKDRKNPGRFIIVSHTICLVKVRNQINKQ